MLTINSSSFCDVCAEEYGPRNQPYSIPCAAGHVLCRRCCNSITEKTPARLSPVCPFCREHFTPESVRVIRTDFSASGTSTPAPEHSYQMSDAWSASNKHHSVLPERPRTSHSSSKHRSEAKRLEDKVARVAGQKSSVEEVSKLHDELQAWLSSSASQEEEKEKLTSLYLSAALLRAILMNHFAFSEVTKTAKNVEASLKGKVDDLEMRNEKLEAELRKQKQQYSTKAQECQSLRSELSRLKALTSMLGVPSSPAAASDAHRSTSLSPTPSSSTPTPTSPTERPPSTTPLSRFNATHSRSASQSASVSSASSRSATPSHFLRPTTPSTSHTLRTYTPAPPTPVRSHTPSSSSSSRAKTPGPSTPTSTSRSRRMSVSSSAYQSPPPLPKMARSSSEEKDPYHRPPSVDPGPPPLTRIRYPSISKAFSLSRS